MKSLHIFDVNTRCSLDLPKVKDELNKLFEKTEGWIDVFGEKDGHHFKIAEVYVDGIDINIDLIETGLDTLIEKDYTIGEIISVTREFIEY